MEPASGDRHRYFEELAVSHVLGGLSESDGRVFRSHLLDCPQCRARVGELRRIANDLADVERDERRVKAAKAIETKRRETDDRDAEFDDATPDPRRSRMVVLVGLVVVLALSGWNFYLRAQSQVMQRDVVNLTIARDLLVDGHWSQARLPTGEFPPPVVRYDAEYALIVMDGVEGRGPFAVYQTNADGVVEDASPGRPVEGDRLTLLIARAPGTRTIYLTTLRDGETPHPSQVTGERILEATLN
jgi:hypothetical protein